VWSARGGYPGDTSYREYYRDLGWDLPSRDLRDVLHGGGRRNVGIKYHRITGDVDLGSKDVYDRARALETVARHARDFVDARLRQLRGAAVGGVAQPVLVSAYDAELFGHWWFEGPEFLDRVFRELQDRGGPVGLTTPAEYLRRVPVCQEAEPAMSTWGANGYAEVWLNPDNDWLYRHLDMAAERMVGLARRFSSADGLEARTLNQAARELALAQASDWAFMLGKGTAVDYAKRRVTEHLSRFNQLREALLEGDLSETTLTELEGRDNIFPEIDFRVFA
jgi:1,4-alpha-glucan branching enzyme